MEMAMNYSNDYGFDVIDYVKKLRNVGISSAAAEVQGQELSHALKTMGREMKTEIKQELHFDDLATKSDIRETKDEARVIVSDLRGTELRLLKEIELVRKEVEFVKKEVEFIKKELELVKKEVKELEIKLVKLEIKIANVKNELIQWVLGVGVTASIVTCGAMFTMLKLMVH